ncbi:MAG: ribosome biogenesis GTPase Der [Candidatus Aminicenantes bacterium]|nr:ribosome biogenesis GTPase Der [Candidatus Aminicenantes bacterium]
MRKPPRIVIVGFPNVGKSTLFNRLLREKKAIIHSSPGMTRDANSSVCILRGKEFELVDTGGFFDSKSNPISEKVKLKAWEASEQADALIFMLDARKGLLPPEKELFVSLKKLNKPMIVVVNKIDSQKMEQQKLGEFYTLGEDSLIPLSAEHKRNIEILEHAISQLLPESHGHIDEEKPLKVAVVGRINVGKSSLINLITGEEKLLVSEIPGTTRDTIDTAVLRNGRRFCLVDTAGIRKLSRTKDKREKAGIIIAKKSIRKADVLCLLMDSTEFPTRQDAAIAHLAYQSGKPLMLALNKWDLIPHKEKIYEEYKKKTYSRLDFVSYAPLVFISALTGKRAVKILDLAVEIYENAQMRIPTPDLNQFLQYVSQRRPPLSKKKKKIKIQYMVQKSVLPPTFVLFTHSSSSLLPSYEKYFSALMRENFDIWGTPLRLRLKKN